MKTFRNLPPHDLSELPCILIPRSSWHRASPNESERRFDDLTGDFWKGMIAVGAQVDRYDGTGENGKRIIRSVLKTSPVILLFQQELQEGREVE